MTQVSGRPDLPDWRVQVLRLSLFPAPDEQPQEQREWERVVGAAPEAIQVNPRTGGFHAVGPWSARDVSPAVLALRVTPARVDWLLQARQDVEDILPTLGAGDIVIDAFRQLLAAWLA